MLIDWLSVNIPFETLSAETVEVLNGLGDRIVRYCPKSGEVHYEISAHDTIRSDSHQISYKFGGSSGLWVHGSPARVMGDGDTVFGAGASNALDLSGCVSRLLAFVADNLGVDLPPVTSCRITRIDVTANLLLDSLPDVRIALRTLRECEGGRYRVSQQAGDTVYWSHTSKMRSGKAYAKGPHLRYLMKKKTYTGRTYTEFEHDLADRLLRLELKLGREFLDRHDWKTLTPEALRAQWENYFMRMIGDSEIKTDSDIKTRVFAAAPTEGQAKAAIGLWALIKAEGWEAAKEMSTKTSFYRNLKILRDAGLGDSDLSTGRVVQLRRRVIECREISSWAELQSACA